MSYIEINQNLETTPQEIAKELYNSLQRSKQTQQKQNNNSDVPLLQSSETQNSEDFLVTVSDYVVKQSILHLNRCPTNSRIYQDIGFKIRCLQESKKMVQYMSQAEKELEIKQIDEISDQFNEIYNFLKERKIELNTNFYNEN